MRCILLAVLLCAPLSSALATPAPPAKTAPALEARFVPAVRDGKPYGLKVYAIKAGSRYETSGLKNGDTLIAVDGQSVNDTATERAFREVMIDGSREGTIELERAGNRLTITMQSKKT